MALHLWLGFFLASWAISLSPGPGAVFVMSASLRHGFARGYFATIGLVLGLLTQLAVVSAGLGALLATSALAFAVVKWAGVAYLVWLGVQQWRAPALPAAVTPAGGGTVPAEPAWTTRRRLIGQAWALNAVNPKGTAFMLAVLPPFLAPGEPLLPQYLAIGATLAFTDLVVNAGYAALAARLVGLLRTGSRVRLANRLFGGAFVALGVLLAAFRRV